MPEALPLQNPHPDARCAIDFLMGRAHLDHPPLVEYIVDETILRPVTERMGRQWVVPGDGPGALDAYLANFAEFYYRMGYSLRGRLVLDQGASSPSSRA